MAWPAREPLSVDVTSVTMCCTRIVIFVLSCSLVRVLNCSRERTYQYAVMGELEGGSEYYVQGSSGVDSVSQNNSKL